MIQEVVGIAFIKNGRLLIVQSKKSKKKFLDSYRWGSRRSVKL